MKRLIVLSAALLILLVSITSCGVPDEVASVPSPTYSELDISFSEDFLVELQPYCAPWVGDVCADAISEGKLHYYFMTGKRMIMAPKEKDPYKWGDSSLIVFPNGQTMLIDVGMPAYAPVLAENLKRMGIEKLDYLMITHPHNDHIGGVIADNSFLDMIAVDTVLYSGVRRDEKTDRLYAYCSDRNIPIQILKKGDLMEFGDVHMMVLWPKEGTDGKVITKTQEVNNSSIVVRFDFEEHSSLFAGDLYVSGEAMVLGDNWGRLNADLLKVPHHGYATSSSGLFISRVSPEIAVAMSGYRTSIQRAYESRDATFLYDRYEGYIHIVSDGIEMSYETDRSES